MGTSKNEKSYKIGLICVIACQVIWGFLPIFWQAIKPIDSWIIILYRIVTMFIYSFAAAMFTHSWSEIVAPLKNKKMMLKCFVAGIFLTLNWSMYIWAINSERVIQTAIGYYIEPLVICAFGIVIFKEKITKYNATAMGLALGAVLVILFHFGQLPIVALWLALTWAIYSAIKKTSELPVLISLTYETVVFAVVALIGIIYFEINGMGGLSYQMPIKSGLLFLSGLVTVIPIGLFGVSAKNVPLVVIGLVQYLSPTITLVCGVYLFKEPIDPVEMVAFGIIWLGLAFFTVGEFKNSKSKGAE